MKRNHATLAVLLAALSFFAAPSASALSQSDLVSIKKTVAEMPAAELAPKAAELVKASKNEKQEVALATVQEVASNRPATIVAVVGAISKAAPEVSAAVAGEAARLVGEQATAIAKAAATAAPAKSVEIAASVSKVAPKFATRVTRAVVSANPERSTDIVNTVVASVPSARTEIERDSTITRITRRMADNNPTTGSFTSRPGTIAGTPAPDVPPSEVGSPTQGADGQREYGTP